MCAHMNVASVRVVRFNLTAFTRSDDMRLHQATYFSFRNLGLTTDFCQCCFFSVKHFMKWYHITNLRVCSTLYLCISCGKLSKMGDIDYESTGKCALNLCEHMCYLDFKNEFISFSLFQCRIQPVIMKCTFSYV